VKKIRYGPVMGEETTEIATGSLVQPNAVQGLDDVDVAILRVLARNARLPNNAIAAEVGIAPSTCLGRIRSLRERGVVRGYFADLDPAALGHPLQAMIAVRLQPHARAGIREFGHQVARLPEVLNVFFLAGADDFLVHVSAPSTEGLRTFVVVHLSGNLDVASTETNLIFEHLRSPAHLSTAAGR
jgi:DNA-binding Lrp family transcriptional regulator